MPTLKQLVSAALGSADGAFKVASAQAPEVDTDMSWLDPEPVSVPAVAEPKVASAPAATPISAMKSAEYGMKIAEALEAAAGLLDNLKVADSVPKTLPTMQAPHLDERASVPKPAGEGPSTSPTLGKAESITNQVNNNEAVSTPATGHPGGAEKGAAWVGDAAATARLIQAKVASATALERLGQVKAAELIRAEVKELETKTAQDPSSPQPVISAGNYVPLALMPAVPAGRAPDNAQAISMTRAQARDSSTREGSAPIKATPKKDPATSAAVVHAEGAKISSADRRALLADIVKVASSPTASPEDRARAQAVIAEYNKQAAAAAGA